MDTTFLSTLFAIYAFKNIISNIFIFALFVVLNTYILINLNKIMFNILYRFNHQNNDHILWNISLFITIFAVILSIWMIFKLISLQYNCSTDELSDLLDKLIVSIKNMCLECKLAINIDDLYNKVKSYIATIFTQDFHMLPHYLHSILIVFLGLILSILFAKHKFYWYQKFDNLTSIEILLPYKERIMSSVLLFHHTMQDWLYGQFLTSVILTIYYGIIFYIFQINFVIIGALIFGFSSFIPYILEFIGYIIIGGDILLYQATSITHIGLLGLLIYLGHIIGPYLLLPMFMNKETRIHPAQIIIGFVVYSQVFGAAGIVLNVMISILLNSFVFGFLGKRDKNDPL